MTADTRQSTDDHFSDTMEITKRNTVRAVADVDSIFGDGYAASHPEVLTAYMKTAALHGIDGSLRELCDTVREAFEGGIKHSGS